MNVKMNSLPLFPPFSLSLFAFICRHCLEGSFCDDRSCQFGDGLAALTSTGELTLPPPQPRPLLLLLLLPGSHYEKTHGRGLAATTVSSRSSGQSALSKLISE